MKRYLFLTLLTFIFLAEEAFSAPSLVITNPSASGDSVSSSSDYATEVLFNPWDMDSRKDLAEFIQAADYSESSGNPDSYNFDGGVFTLPNPGFSDPYFHMLSPGQPSTNPLGKNGQRLPIDSIKYRYLVFRMFSTNSDVLRVHWNSGNSYATNFVRSRPIRTSAGWHTYVVDMENFVIESRSNEDRSWSGAAKVTGLRFDIGVASGVVKFDWMRLVDGAGSYTPSYTFTPDANDTRYSMVLDNNNDPLDGYLSVAMHGKSAVSGESLSTREVVPGEYYVHGIISDDYASLNANPWDMNDSSDVPSTFNLSNTSFSGGSFSGTLVSGGGYFDLAVGNSLIDTSVFRYLSIKATYSNGGIGSVRWFSKDGTHLGSTSYVANIGTNIYNIDLASLGTWSGEVALLRFDVPSTSGLNFSYDFITLTENDYRSSLADPIVVTAPGFLTVNSPPSFKVLQPDPKGGADFATTVLGNPWNFDSISDLHSTTNLKDAFIYPNNYVNGRQGDFFCGTSKEGNEDPYQTSLAEAVTSDKRIDASKYRNVTVESFVNRPQDVVNGSVMRIIGWNLERDSAPINGDDTMIQSSNLEWFELTQDMTKMALEPLLHPEGSYHAPFWDGMYDIFRVDIHEFSEETFYCVDSIQLRADDAADTQFALTYSLADVDSDPSSTTVSFYYNTTEVNSGGTLIVSALELSRNSQVYLWDTSAIPNGSYYVYAVATDGLNSITAPGHRITIDHSNPQNTVNPVLKLDQPLSGETYFQNLRVEGYAIDDIQVALVEVLIDGDLAGTFVPGLFNKEAQSAYSNYADASDAGFRELVNIESYSLGSHTALIRVYDTAGNVTTQSVFFTRSTGTDPVISNPPIENDPLITVPTTGTTQVEFKANLNIRKRTLNLTVNQADLCSTLEIVGGLNKSELENNTSSATVLKTLTNPSSSVKFTAKKLKALLKNKEAGNKNIFLGAVCDGRISKVRRIKVLKLNTNKKVKTWQKYLTVLTKKLKKK